LLRYSTINVQLKRTHVMPPDSSLMADQIPELSLEIILYFIVKIIGYSDTILPIENPSTDSSFPIQKGVTNGREPVTKIDPSFIQI
jgi:hypothetical protein